MELIRKSETEKKNLSAKSEKDVALAKKDYEAKLVLVKNEITKLEHDIKQKDEQISAINFANEKLNSLNQQKVKLIFLF